MRDAEDGDRDAAAGAAARVPRRRPVADGEGGHQGQAERHYRGDGPSGMIHIRDAESKPVSVNER